MFVFAVNPIMRVDRRHFVVVNPASIFKFSQVSISVIEDDRNHSDADQTEHAT
jgi:hypothetical protein